MKEETRRIVLLILGILIMLVLITGVSYARFNDNLASSKIEELNNGCLEIAMSDSGSILMNDAVPISDEEGLKKDSYEFSIKNICTMDAHYEVTLNVLDPTTKENIDKVKVALIGDGVVSPTIVSKLPETKLLDETIVGIQKTYKLSDGTLKTNEEKHFNLNQWIDYDVTEFTGKFVTKVIINSTAEKIE